MIRPVLAEISGSWPSAFNLAQMSDVRRSCQTMARCTACPVARSHTTVVSRWLVMPIAAMSCALRPAFSSGAQEEVGVIGCAGGRGGRHVGCPPARLGGGGGGGGAAAGEGVRDQGWPAQDKKETHPGRAPPPPRFARHPKSGLRSSRPPQ